MKNQSKPITDAGVWSGILAGWRAEKDGTVVTVNGAEFKVKVVDPTHVTMKMVGSETGIAWAYHVQQLGDETVRQLQAAGVMDERRYVKEAL